jgi:hypothetical protein
MNQQADDGAPARRRTGWVEGGGSLQQNLAVLVVTVGLLPLYGEILMYVAILPLGCTARLIACAGTWRTRGRDWFVAATLLGLGFGVMTFLAGMAIQPPPRPITLADLEHISDHDLPLVGGLSPQMQMLAWVLLALAALEGFLCIAYAFAHRRYEPRHAAALYVSGILDIAAAALLFSLSGRASSVDETALTYLLAVGAALMLGVSLGYGGRAFVRMADDARAEVLAQVQVPSALDEIRRRSPDA